MSHEDWGHVRGPHVITDALVWVLGHPLPENVYLNFHHFALLSLLAFLPIRQLFLSMCFFSRILIVCLEQTC